LWKQKMTLFLRLANQGLFRSKSMASFSRQLANNINLETKVMGTMNENDENDNE